MHSRRGFGTACLSVTTLAGGNKDPIGMWKCDAMREGKIHHWAEDGVEREDDGIGVSFAQSRSNDGGK